LLRQFCNLAVQIAYMGISDRHIEYRDKYRQPGFQFNINSPVVMLIIFNFSIFLFVMFLSFGKATGDTSISPYLIEKMDGLLLPASANSFLSQPWSAVTYAFFHFSFLSIVSNMLWLWGFGTLLQNLSGNKNTFPVYLYGALAGAAAFIITAEAMGAAAPGAGSYLFGANAAAMSVAVATTTIAPNYRLFPQMRGGIPLWVLTAVYVFIDLFSLGRSGAQPYYAAHLAAAGTGFGYMLSYKKGTDWGAWMNQWYNWFMNLFNPGKKKKSNSVKEKVFYNTGNRTPYNKTANITQQRVDEILDKINQKGYHFLTEEEKNILKRASEE